MLSVGISALHWTEYAAPASLAILSHSIFSRWEPEVTTAISLFIWSTASFYTLLVLGVHLSWAAAAVQLATFQLIYFVTLFTSISIYRLSPFHPLAGIPGPVMSRLTQAVWFRVNQGLHARLWIEEMHQQYGPIVRIGPNHLSWADAEAMQYAHGFKGAWERSHAYLRGIMAGKNPEDAALGRLKPRAEHRARRRIFEPAFVAGALQNLEPVVIRCSARLMRLLEKKEGEVIDLATHVRFFTWEFMNLAVFSEPQDTLDIGFDKSGMIDKTVEVARWGLKFDAMPWLRDIIFQIIPLPTMFKDVLKYADNAFKKRLVNGPNELVNRDIFSYVTKDGDSGTKLTQAQMSSDSFGLIFGAVDTTAQAFSIAMMFVLDTPGCFAKLRAELEKEFEAKEVTIKDTSHLPYLNAVINESLRLMNPIPSGVSRQCPTDQVILNQFIPANTTVRFPTYVIQRDSANFSPGAKDFRPERWINPDLEDAFNLAAFFPFNVGHHACIGRALALQEMRYLMASMVLQFDLKLAPGFDVGRFFNDSILDMFFSSFTDPIPVIMTKRQGVSFSCEDGETR